VQKHYGIRTERYTLAHFYPVNEWELFDLEKDPLQLKSVVSDPAYAKTVSELKAELARLRMHYRDSDEIEPVKGNKKTGKEPARKKANGSH